jgi:hypothetical protein
MRVSLTILAGLLAAATAHAGFLTIGDPSFEGVSLSPNGFTAGTYAPNSWNSSANAGIFRPTTASYPGGVPDGVNVGYAAGGSDIDQVLTSNLTANTTYTLSINVGSRLDPPHNGSYSIELLAGGVVLSGITSLPAPADGTFVFATDTYTAGPGDPHLGQALEIQLISGLTGQTSFDNVKLDAEPAVPEPSSYLLLTLAATGAGWLRWRGRYCARS